MVRPAPLVVFALAALAPSSAWASPLLETMGAVGGNAGAQGVTSGPASASTYFNPALLMDADDEVLLGFALLSEQLGVTLDGRPAGADVPVIVGTRGVVDANGKPLPPSVVPTQWLTNGCAPARAA
jgi:hypothetical protein